VGDRMFGSIPTVFYDDQENDLLVAAVPNTDMFGYFGYLKKMTLTLHNIRMMKKGRWPFHGALVKLTLHDREHTLLLVGDTGTGKSETIEAFRILSDELLQDMIIIADDMGSVDLDEQGLVIGYGTEVGAFVRLDDLQPGYAFGQMGRAIFMSPNKINARVLLPVTSYASVMRGSEIDIILYANNYEEVDDGPRRAWYNPTLPISLVRRNIETCMSVSLGATLNTFLPPASLSVRSEPDWACPAGKQKGRKRPPAS